MSDPITTGIGLGVGTSLLTGGNPLVGGALGGLGGGVFGGFQPGGFASGWFGTPAAAGATTGGSAFAPSMLGQATMNPSLLGQTVTPSILSGTAGGALPLNAFDRISNAVNSVTAPYENWASENPFLAKTGGNLLQNQLFGSQSPQIQPNPLSQIGIIPGQNSLAGRVTGLKTTAQQLPPRTVFGGYRG